MLLKVQHEPRACNGSCSLGVRVIKTQNSPANQARFGYPGIKKQMFVVVPVRALTLNHRDPPSSMPCLSPGLLTYQPPLSPLPQALSARQAEPPSAGTGSRKAACWGDTGSSRSFLAPLYLCLLHFLCGYSLLLVTPQNLFDAGSQTLPVQGCHGLAQEGVKLPVKPTWVGFLPLL